MTVLFSTTTTNKLANIVNFSANEYYDNRFELVLKVNFVIPPKKRFRVNNKFTSSKQ